MTSNRPFNRIALTLSAIAATATLGIAQVGTAPASPTTAPASRPARPPRGPNDSVTPTVKNPERHDQFLKRIQEGPVGLLFLGDSITDWWPRNGADTWAKFAEYQPANFGIAGDRTEHLLWRLQNGELEGIKPKVAVMMIGTNNIGPDKPDQIAAGVKKDLDTVREKLPDTKVLLLAIFPRSTNGSGLRKAVDEINPMIAKFADGKNVRWLDIGKVFLDADGNIPRDVMRDGLHPTAKGYQLWYDAMKPTLDEMWNEK